MTRYLAFPDGMQALLTKWSHCIIIYLAMLNNWKNKLGKPIPARRYGGWWRFEAEV